MKEPRQIAYRYTGPVTYRGIPAYDLTHERVELLPLKLQGELARGLAGYEKVKAAKAADSDAKAEKGEVN